MSGARHTRDPALKAQRLARDRLVRQGRQAKARAEAVAVADGVAETVALSRARGSAVVGGGRGAARAEPMRRLSGLEWLAAKGKISAQAKAAGERYGWVYRRVKLETAIPSTLAERVRGSFVAPALEDVLAHGEGTEAARRRLAELRRRLSSQPDLVAACDLICGEEKTPREAAGGDREAGKLEAVLKVALDLLSS
jgi:hypothetical protein